MGRVFIELVSQALANIGGKQDLIARSRVQVNWQPERTIYRVKPIRRHMRPRQGTHIGHAAGVPRPPRRAGEGTAAGAQGRPG